MKGKQSVVALTAYDAITASWADGAGVELILVGDSLGNTALGLPSTVGVQLKAMVHHAKAVMRAKPRALVVLDIPFGWAARDADALLKACVRAVQQSGVDAVKLEGGAELAPKIDLLTKAGIPVLGHVGLLPQQILQLGAYRRFGKSEAEREALALDVQALEAAGVFGIVAEAVVPKLAAELAQASAVPIIGIGSGTDLDGQILVLSDVLGLHEGHYPSFSKQFANLGQSANKALTAYAESVRKGAFPEA